MSDPAFHPTRWTLVLRARGEGVEAKAALSDLCAAYYAPVIAFLRREGREEDAAREMAHAFFAAVLEGGVGRPDQERGRFRSYLLGSLKHFLSKQRAATGALKRGGGAVLVPLTAETDTAPGLPPPVAPGPPPEWTFDREWAFTLIARALNELEAEHTHRPGYFAALKPWLEAAPDGEQSRVAEALDMSGTALRVAIHRLRVRFRELVRAEVAATVYDPADTSGELQHLIAIVTA